MDGRRFAKKMLYALANIQVVPQSRAAKLGKTLLWEGVVDLQGVKVFSATKARDREALGEQVTNWLRGNPDCEIVDKIVTQSSDSEFHCLSITLFYKQPATA